MWCSLGALILVWWEITMALVVSYHIPTVGMGCRSGLILIFGILSTAPWLAQMFQCLGPPQGTNISRYASRVLNWVSNVFLAFSIPCLLFITFAAVSTYLPPYLSYIFSTLGIAFYFFFIFYCFFIFFFLNILFWIPYTNQPLLFLLQLSSPN